MLNVLVCKKNVAKNIRQQKLIVDKNNRRQKKNLLLAKKFPIFCRLFFLPMRYIICMTVALTTFICLTCLTVVTKTNAHKTACTK